jgi:hypothetical protein
MAQAVGKDAAAVENVKDEDVDHLASSFNAFS